jgi:hypothetical protein
LIEIAQRRMQYTSITDEKGAAIKIRKAGRREMALLLGRSWTSERLIERSQVRNTPCRRKTNSNSLRTAAVTLNASVNAAWRSSAYAAFPAGVVIHRVSAIASVSPSRGGGTFRTALTLGGAHSIFKTSRLEQLIPRRRAWPAASAAGGFLPLQHGSARVGD